MGTLNQTVLDLQDLCIRWDRQVVVRGLRLCLRRGSILVVLGPGGSGKSTLLRVIEAMVADPERHEILDGPRWEGQSLVGVRRCARLPQHGLFDERSLLHLLGDRGVSPHKLPRDPEVRAALLAHASSPFFAVPEPLRRYGSALLTACCDAPLLLFDEPTAELPPRWGAELCRLFLCLRKEGRSCIVVTHNLAFARRIGDQVGLLERGELVEVGEREDFFDRPRRNRTRVFLKWGA